MSRMPTRRPHLLVPCLVAVVAWTACGERQSPEPDSQGAAAPPAQAAAPPLPAEAAVSSRPERRGWTGVVVARESVDVTAETQGRVRAMHVQIGDAVQRGQPIASLDASIAGQDLEMARSALRAAEADASRVTEELGEARVRNERRKSNPELFSKEELAEVELRVKTAGAALQVAQARVSEQRARVRQLEAALGQTEVRAPFAGRVAERFVDLGAVIGPGTALVRLISSGDLMVRTAVPPEEARGLAAGSAVVVEPRNTGAEVRGVIERIAPEVDAASQMVLIEVRIDRTAGGTGGSGGSRALQTGQVVDVRRASAGGPQEVESR